MKESRKPSRVNILWTGGWDSTFRLLQLVEKEIEIQPYYLRDNRASEEHELHAIRSITAQLHAMDSTRCHILPVQIEAVKEVAPDAQITQAFDSLLNKIYFGSQYDWLARFAKDKEHLELGIHEDDKAFRVIKLYGDVIRRNDPEIGDYYLLDPEASSEELLQVFGKFRFPLLQHTKLDMKKQAEEKGLLHIMNKTWFCYKPINDKPCGLCNPCRYSIEEGMRYRFSQAALRRYDTRRVKSVLSRIKSKVSKKWKTVTA